jgi:AraC-like DNA-binding protein
VSHILSGEAQQTKQEAKALLKSTNMTIQQISDELNFPSQSFFGKYFKRVVGVSPKEYRESKMQ